MTTERQETEDKEAGDIGQEESAVKRVLRQATDMIVDEHKLNAAGKPRASSPGGLTHKPTRCRQAKREAPGVSPGRLTSIPTDLGTPELEAPGVSPGRLTSIPTNIGTPELTLGASGAREHARCRWKDETPRAYARGLSGSPRAGIALLIALLLLTCHLRAAELTVGSGQKHKTITSALAAARVGDRITVKPGTYKETLLWPKVHGIQLISEAGAKQTTIVGNGKHPVIKMEGPLKWDTVIEGFTIRGGGSGHAAGEFGAGLNITGASPTIKNCIITGNTAKPYRGTGGVFLWDSRAVLEHCEIRENSFQDGDLHAGGVCVWGGMPKIRKNLIKANAGENPAFFTRGSGMRLQASKAIVRENAIRENVATSYGSGLYAAQADRSCVYGNAITGNRNLGGSYGAVVVEQNSDPRIGGERPGEANAIHDNIHAFIHDPKGEENTRNLHPKFQGLSSRTIGKNWFGGSDKKTLDAQLVKIKERPKAATEEVKIEDAGMEKK